MLAQGATSKTNVDTVAMTGCVALGDKPGEYVLNPTAEGAGSTSPDPTHPAPAADTARDGKVMSYQLKGGELKGHIGHKVVVTGTLEDYKPSTSAHQMPGATAVIAADLASRALHVKSVKMIGSSCS